jgi:predicted acetyltransferase
MTTNSVSPEISRAASQPIPSVDTYWDGELMLALSESGPGNPATGQIPFYKFHFMVEGSDKPAGNISLRIGSTDDLILYFGHIGYGVEPAFQGHHYAARACRLLLPLARAHGLNTLWITCNPENTASRRTCEWLGAVLVEIVDIPRRCDLYRQGERKKCRYSLDLTEVLPDGLCP